MIKIKNNTIKQPVELVRRVIPIAKKTIQGIIQQSKNIIRQNQRDM